MNTQGTGSFALGLLGQGIGASLSPAMHEQAGRLAGLNLTYRVLDADELGIGPDDLPEVLTWIERLGFSGINVTHPFKQTVVPLLDDLSVDAAALGAVNTVVLRDGRRTGHNTDCSGFAHAFAKTLPEATHDRALVLGAGGAGRAVALALLGVGASQVTLYDPDLRRAEECAERLRARVAAERVQVCADPGAVMGSVDGVVNATPIGMRGHAGIPLDPAVLIARHWVADIVYFPLETQLLSLARLRGCRVMSGGGMAVEQAVAAFAHFTGAAPDADAMAAQFRQLTQGEALVAR